MSSVCCVGLSVLALLCRSLEADSSNCKDYPPAWRMSSDSKNYEAVAGAWWWICAV